MRGGGSELGVGGGRVRRGGRGLGVGGEELCGKCTMHILCNPKCAQAHVCVRVCERECITLAVMHGLTALPTYCTEVAANWS